MLIQESHVDVKTTANGKESTMSASNTRTSSQPSLIF